MGQAITIVSSGGLAVTESLTDFGWPVEVVASGGIAATLVASGGLPIVASGPTYYVDTAGSDSNDGLTQATAWQTITKVNAQSFIIPGTSVKFKGGQTVTGTIVPNNGASITIGSYGTGQATISSAGNNGITIQNKAGVTVRDLIVLGNGIATNTGHGIFFDNSQAGNTKLTGINIINCTVSGYGKNGINVTGSSGYSGFNNVTISGCIVHDCTGNYLSTEGSAGIYVYSHAGYGVLSAGGYSHTNVTITNCVSYNNTGTAATTNWTGSGITIGETNGATVQYCEAYNNGANGTSPNGPVGIWTYDSKAVTIKYCEAYLNKTGIGKGDGGGFDIDGGCQDCIVEYCYSHDNMGAGFQIFNYADASLAISQNVTYRYNISQNDGTQAGGSVLIDNDDARGITGMYFYNNTIYSNLGISFYLIRLLGTQLSAVSGYVANNIFYSFTDTVFIHTDAPSTRVLFRGNDYYTTGTFTIYYDAVTYNSFAAWQTATNQEKISGANVGLTSNPGLVSPGFGGTIHGYVAASPAAYGLLPGSPVLAAGLNLTAQFGISVGSQDYYGNAIPSSGTYPVGAGVRVGNFNASTDSIAAAFSTPPTAARKIAMNDLANGLQNNSAWSNWDGFFVHAAADAQAGKVNWKNPGTYTAVAVNSPTFTADRGFTGNGSNAKLNSPYNLSSGGGHFAQNDAEILSWALSTANDSGGTIGGTTGTTVFLLPKYLDNFAYIGINSTGAEQYSDTPANAAGLVTAVRKNSSNFKVYRAGAVVATKTSASQALLNETVDILNCDALASSSQVAISAFGAGTPDATAEAALYYYMHAYLKEVGAVA